MTTQEHKTPADVLLAAAELLEKPGAWTQNTFGLGDCYCVRSAISAAAGQPYRSAGDGPAELALAKTLPGFDTTRDGDLFGHSGSVIVRWNDATERTQSEVVAKLREAAALAREAGQ